MTFESGAGEETSHGLRERERDERKASEEKQWEERAEQRKEPFCGTFLQLKHS